MKHARLTAPALLLTAGLILGWADPAAAAGGPRTKPPVPDFTQGGTKDDFHDWTLGPTGARGWVYGWKGNTNNARQILVTAVAKGSPADGILQPGDAILGTGGKAFADDARIQFARAIMAAEEEDSGGVLPLIRWRDGQSRNVELKLKVLGSYRATAPYDCPKSKRIFEAGCQAIARAGLEKANISNHLNALALLASGKEEYRPLLADYAPKVAASLRQGTWTWFFGYGNLFLAEYVLATGDRSILPELKRTTMAMVHGQSAVGTWGHEYYATPSGNLNGCYYFANSTDQPVNTEVTLRGRMKLQQWDPKTGEITELKTLDLVRNNQHFTKAELRLEPVMSVFFVEVPAGRRRPRE